MMDAEWSAILARYGQNVIIYEADSARGTSVRAFLQNIDGAGKEQYVPTPLGLCSEERLLYLGPRDRALTADVSIVEWNGQKYDVQSAHPVGAESTHHWWAVLRPREKEGA